LHTKRYGNIPTGTPELLQPICHLPGRFGEDRLGGLRDIAMQQKTEKKIKIKIDIAEVERFYLL